MIALCVSVNPLECLCKPHDRPLSMFNYKQIKNKKTLLLTVFFWWSKTTSEYCFVLYKQNVNRVVDLVGFEPTTLCLQSRCSNQLSHKPITKFQITNDK